MREPLLRLSAKARLEVDPDGNGGLLMDTYDASLFSCNSTAWAIVNTLARGATAEEVVRRLRAEFEVDLETARNDVAAVLRRLTALDFVEGR